MSAQVALARKGATTRRHRTRERLDASVDHLVALDIGAISKRLHTAWELADVGFLSSVDANVALERTPLGKSTVTVGEMANIGLLTRVFFRVSLQTESSRKGFAAASVFT